MTDGHIGFLTYILSQCILRNDITDEKSLAQYLLSPFLVRGLSQHRGSLYFSNMTERQKHICRQIVLRGSYPSQEFEEEMEAKAKQTVDPHKEGAFSQLVRQGLCKTQDGFSFASPLILHVASIELFKSQNMDDQTSTLTKFLFMVLQKLDPKNLRETLGGDTGKVERSWQREFFRVAELCLREVGPIFGSSGRFGFYVRDKQWGIELTHESRRRVRQSLLDSMPSFRSKKKLN